MADFLDGVFSEKPPVEEPEATEVAQEPQQEPVEPEPQAEPAPEPTPEPEQPAVQEAEARNVPLNVVLDERDKRKAAEAERDRYKQQWEEAQARQAPQNAPDPYDDPQGFAAFQEQRFQQGLVQQKFQMSEVMAKQAHGAEVVDAAAQWALEKAKTEPAFAAAYHQQAHPLDWIVQQHKRDVDLSDYASDPVAFARRILEANGQQIAPVTAAAPAVAPQVRQNAPTPPRSIAGDAAAPTAAAPTDERAGFLANFTR